ncbi:choline transporter-like 2 isoform X2 [Halyomorpha halys]|uniref:choline transporter-like 2 isoform X2 n=1 Tax=Halyomorpha halys TaxID=286706 RepID=UPI0006D4D71A|nr:CTL-like protein 2 isoform X3 [Halyomorpha halys]
MESTPMVVQLPKRRGPPLKYDPEFKGPRKRRSCTDIICLFLFTAFVIVWTLVGLYALKNGNPEKILRPTDSSGRKCGLDSEVIDRPYLFFFDLTKCADPSVVLNGCDTPQVCVRKCPDTQWNAEQYISGGKPFDLKDVQNNLICISDDIKSSIDGTGKLRNAISSNQCAGWYTVSNPLHRRCIPSFINNTEISWKTFNKEISQAIITLHETLSSYSAAGKISEVGLDIFEDLKTAWKIILASFSVAIVVSLLYITLLRWIAGIMTWLSIIALLALTITASIFSYKRFDYLRNTEPPEVKNRMIMGKLEELLYKPGFWITLTVILGIFALIIFLLTVFLRKRIAVAVTLIKEGSRAVSSTISSLFFPLFPWILQCAVALWFLISICYLMSIGTDVFMVRGLATSSCTCTGEYLNIKTGDLCEPQKFQMLCTSNSGPCTDAGCRFLKQDQPSVIAYLEWFNVFGLFWGIWFASGFSQMVLAGAFATWYWTYDKNNVPFFVVTRSMFRTLRYHLGTIAFGSLILAICSFIRAIIEYIEKKLKRYSDNALVKCLFCCLKCFFWCLERFLRVINRNAYILCAIHGKNFCSSARSAFSLLMRNAVRVVVLDKVTDFLFFVGKLLISGCMVAGSYYLFVRNQTIPLHYNGAVPLTVIGIGSYIIASIFFGVYSMAVDTLFLCFLEDCERNDGSVEKPYFMSKNLMKILGKKNKKPK